MKTRTTGADRILDGIVYVLLLLGAVAALFPLFYVFAISFSTEREYLTRGFYIIPEQFTLDGYFYLMTHSGFKKALINAVLISAIGTLINMALTTLMAYGLSKPWLKGRGFLNFIVVFTMLFSGGMIPTYLVVNSLGLINSFWALWLSSAVIAFNLVVMRSFFRTFPAELEESARIDGSGEWRLLATLVIPLSMPAIATFTLFYLVNNWNTYFSAILYLNDNNLMPLQVFLRQMLIEDDPSISNASSVQYRYTPAAKMAAIIITAMPLLIAYPFFQKHFNKGVLLGSVKG
ncbi:putative aldouronate transport system permease protein [Paenibacillus sp. UNCCL117]|uniref:carbohydrate ABC transporter permease n=1 Tax=unclassified Paenibacillus TaxID=185978 RepID=UPI00088B41A3|nr:MULTISPECIES: carbohydrate ABC transporter permease [unclassified Paenibacillus]SDD41050.1 putative aldouronate transport system permease protein [Paenibacillus sp. cl123]SFW47942.1 putative aldouronate transport system permease protein [Paenibacillus sp. UNCCL117]